MSPGHHKNGLNLLFMYTSHGIFTTHRKKEHEEKKIKLIQNHYSFIYIIRRICSELSRTCRALSIMEL